MKKFNQRKGRGCKIWQNVLSVLWPSRTSYLQLKAAIKERAWIGKNSILILRSKFWFSCTTICVRLSHMGCQFPFEFIDFGPVRKNFNSNFEFLIMIENHKQDRNILLYLHPVAWWWSWSAPRCTFSV